MKKSINNGKIATIVLLISILVFATTYALSDVSMGVNLTTANIGVDELAYGDTNFNAENIDFKPILDNEVEEKVDNIIKIDFTVGGASNNDEDVDIIYDIALNDLEVNCNLLSPYIKWKLIKDGEQISSGSLDYQFDTIKNGRLVLTTIQEDLPTYSSDKTNYDDYTFYMWFSDSCQGNLADCDNAEDQTGMLGQNLNGKIEVELYTGNKKELNRQPKTSLGESTCLDKYLVTLEPNKGTVETDTIFVYSGGTYTDLETPTRTDTITFETNGGTIVEPNYTNDQVTIPYTFQGWYLDENFETEITSSDIVETNSNHTLYAKWDSYDNEIVLPTLEKENANFSGWYKDSLLKLKIGDAGESYTVNGSQTLYAAYDVESTNIITITLNNDTCSGTDTIYLKYGEGYYSDINATNPITSIAKPTCEGKTFNGYNNLTDAEGNITASTTAFEGDTNIDILLSETENIYLVTFDLQDGFCDFTSTNVTFGETLPESCVPTRSGNYTVTFNYDDGSITTATSAYVFDGFYTEENGNGTKYYNANGEPLKTWDIASDTTLYANWIGTNIILPTSSSKSGYDFLGWYDINDTKVGNSGDSYSIDSNISLYEKWEATSYELTIDVQGATTPSNNIITSASYNNTMPSITNEIKKEYSITYHYNGNGMADTTETFSYKLLGIYRYQNGVGTKYYNNDLTAVAENKWDILGASTIFVDWSENCITLPTVEYAGKNFAGWYTASSGGTLIGIPGENYCPTSNTDLYAVWTDNPAYTINYNLNNGTFGLSHPTSATYGVDFEISTPTKSFTLNYNANNTGVTLSETTFTGNFKFIGWKATNLNNTAKFYKEQGVYTTWDDGNDLTTATNFKNLKNETGTVTLTANWNWSSSLITLPNLEKTDYDCSWNTSADGTGTTYIADGTGTYKPSATGEATETLYAYCVTNNYTITLEQDDATTRGTESVNVIYNNDLPSIIVPEREYTVTLNPNGGTTSDSTKTVTHTFDGYWTNSDGTGTQYYDATGTGKIKWNIYNNASLYAKWGSCSLTLPSPTRTGYTFNGWYTASSGGTKITDNTCLTSDITLYAQWTSIQYTISYNLNGGEYGTSHLTSARYDTNIKIDNPTKTYEINFNANGTGATFDSTPITGNFTFAGWSATNINTATAIYGTQNDISVLGDISTPWTNGANKVTAIWFKNLRSSAGTVTLTAHWNNVENIQLPSITKTGYTCYWSDEEGNQVSNPYTISGTSTELYASCSAETTTVTFDKQGGSGGTDTVTATYGSSMPAITKPTNSCTITYNTNVSGVTVDTTTANKTFNGYYSSTNGGGTQYYTGTGSSARTWNLTSSTATLYASWSDNFSFTLPSAEREGWTLEGWYSDSSLTTKVGNPGSTYTQSSCNVTTLYANWIDDIPPTCTYELTPNADTYTNDRVTIRVTCTDMGSGIAKYNTNTTGVTPTSWLDLAQIKTSHSLTTTVYSNTIRYYWAKDAAENPSERLEVNVANIDKTSPTVDDEAFEYTGDTEAKITFTATDNLSGINTCQATSGNNTYTGTISNDTCTITNVPTGYTYTLTATDNATNVSTSKSLSIATPNYKGTYNTTNYWTVTLDEAIDLATTTTSYTTTIKVLNNVTDSGTFDGNRKFILNLNTKTLTTGSNSSDSNDRLTVSEGSTLTINGNGTITSSGATTNVIRNSGTLNITNGTFSNTSSENTYSMIANVSTGTTKIYGGTYSSQGYTIGTTSTSKLSINGSSTTITSTVNQNEKAHVGALYAANGTTYVNSGVNITNNNGLAIRVGDSSASTLVNVDNATINGNASIVAGNLILDNGTVLTRTNVNYAGVYVSEGGTFEITKNDPLLSTSVSTKVLCSKNNDVGVAQTVPLIDTAGTVIQRIGDVISNHGYAALIQGTGSYELYTGTFIGNGTGCLYTTDGSNYCAANPSGFTRYD